MAKCHDDISNYLPDFNKYFHSLEFDFKQIIQCKCLMMGFLPYPNIQYTKTGNITKCFKWRLKRNTCTLERCSPSDVVGKNPKPLLLVAGRFLLYEHACIAT